MRKLSMALLAGVALVGCGVDSEQEIVSNLVQAGFTQLARLRIEAASKAPRPPATSTRGAKLR